MEEQKPQPVAIDLTISVDELIPFIKKEWSECEKFMSKKRAELGPRYNEKNIFEEAPRRFCNPEYNTDKWALEYFLILEKKSKLPSSVRKAVEAIVGPAYEKLARIKLEAWAKQEQAKASANIDKQ